MCMSCGCKQPNEAHKDERNITMRDLEQAAEASEISPQEVVTNIQQGFDSFGRTGEPAGVRAHGNERAFENRAGDYRGATGPR